MGKSSVQKNFTNLFALKEVKLHFPRLKFGLSIVISFQRGHYGKKDKSNFAVEKPEKHHISQVMKIKHNVGHVDRVHPRYNVKTMPF